MKDDKQSSVPTSLNGAGGKATSTTGGLNQQLLPSVVSHGDDDSGTGNGLGGARVSPLGPNGKRPTETTALLSTPRGGDSGDCNDRMEQWRLSVYVFMNGNNSLSRAFQLGLVMLILLNISVFVLSTESSIAIPNKPVFDQIEIISVAIFTVEYICRLWTIVESGQKAYQSPVWGRFKYAMSVTALIDLVSIATFYLGLMINTKLPGLTWIRALRIFRILKTEAYTNAFHSLTAVIALNQEILGVGLAVAAVLLLLTSTFLYYVEKDDDPDQFGSIPKCMYASMMMLTGQGPPNPPVGGDFPIVTKVAISLTAFFSVAIFAIPAAMLAYGFEVEADKVRRWKLTNQKLKEKCAREGKPYIPLPIEKFAGFDSDLDDSDMEDELHGGGKTKTGGSASATAVNTTAGTIAAPKGDSVSVSVSPVAGVVAGCLTCPHCNKQLTVSLTAT